MDQSEYISKLEAQNKLLLEQVTLLTYELRDMKRMLFGRKSERFLPQPPTAQLNLAELMAEAVTPPVITQEVKVIKKQTTEVKPTGRHALPAHLPKVDIVQQKARQDGVRDTQIEKDYILSWILWGIARHEVLSKCLVFKGQYPVLHPGQSGAPGEWRIKLLHPICWAARWSWR